MGRYVSTGNCLVCRTSKSKRDGSKTKNPRRYLLMKARIRSGQKKIKFNITEEDIIVPTHCPILGIKLKFGNRDTAPSLDRIDNRKGYIPGNVAVISGRANRLKWNMSLEVLEKLVVYVKEA